MPGSTGPFRYIKIVWIVAKGITVLINDFHPECAKKIVVLMSAAVDDVVTKLVGLLRQIVSKN